MQYGKRILYNTSNGTVIGVLGEMEGTLQEGLRPAQMDFVDLPFGDTTTLANADTYHVDINTKSIVVDTTIPYQPTPDELMQAYLAQQGVI